MSGMDLKIHNWQAMARTDVAFLIMFPHDMDEIWVEVVKNRYGKPSRHAFADLAEAMHFIKNFPRSLPE